MPTCGSSRSWAQGVVGEVCDLSKCGVNDSAYNGPFYSVHSARHSIKCVRGHVVGGRRCLRCSTVHECKDFHLCVHSSLM